jgi:hypothetical protein
MSGAEASGSLRDFDADRSQLKGILGHSLLNEVQRIWTSPRRFDQALRVCGDR